MFCCVNLLILSLNQQHLLSRVFSFVEGAGSLPWPGGSAAKPGKPKGKKKISSVRQKFDVSVHSEVVMFLMSC